MKIIKRVPWMVWILLGCGLALGPIRAALAEESSDPAPAASSETAGESQPELRTFEVQATAKSAYFFDNGKLKESVGGDQAVYFVDLPKKTVTRTAVFYVPRKKKKEAGDQIIQGLKADSTAYAVVYYKNDFMKGQLIIKAIGQTASDDGFETLVIGEDFVTSTVSTKGFVTLTYFERTDAEARTYRAKKTPAKAKPQPRYGQQQSMRPSGVKNSDTAVGWAKSNLAKFNKWRHERVDESSY